MEISEVVVEAVRWLSGCWLLWRVPRCGEGSVSAPGAVSVVVPARDEEASLPALLGSLAAQDPRPSQVVVVDDHSTDSTAERARRAGVDVVEAPDLPPGWTGKAWACATGATAAGAVTLVFLDADTRLEPGGLLRLVAEHARRGGLVSVQPVHLTGRLYESLSAFFNVVAMMGTDAFSPLGDRRQPSGAFGPCLICSRRDYEAVGGHASVRGEVLDDVALARRFRAAGLPVSCLGGRGVATFRMYPGGWRQLVEGWSKNFAGGAGATRLVTLALVACWLSGCILAGWNLVSEPGWRAAAVYTLYAGQLWWMLRRIGRFSPLAAALFPVPLVFFLAVFVRSVVLTVVRRRVTWKGRSIPTGSAG